MISRDTAFYLVALVAAAGGIGLWLGGRNVPPSETTIIDAAAQAYVAETGGALTDCAARPSALPDVRLVVICADGAWVAGFDRFGRPVSIDAQSLEEEPTT